MMPATSRLRLLLLVVLPVTFVGCRSEEPSGLVASGTVVADGTPLSGAVLTLEPVKGTSGPNASAPVFDGSFEFLPSAGLVGGTYTVRVSMIPSGLRKGLPPEQLAKLPDEDAVIHPKFDTNSKTTWELNPDTENRRAFTVDFL